MSNFFEELKKRNVYKVTVAYLVTSWLIIQVVDTIGPNLNWSDSVGPLITKLLIVGFPIALILTWLYEFTPKGLKLTGKTQEDTEDNRRTGKRLNQTIIVALSLVLIVLLIDKLFVSGPVLYNEKQIASIGVLPFINRTVDPDHEFYADSLTEQILNELATISALRVPARTSSFAFKNKNQDISIIAERMKVNYVLEGSIRFDSVQNRIWIRVHLINASTGYHMWSNTYDEYFDSIFDIQEDISRKVAAELKVRLIPQEDEALAGQLTENTEAYKLYLKSRQYSMKRDDENLGTAIGILNEALDIDPNFAVAHAELSTLYSLRFFYGNVSKQERDEKREYHIRKAIELDPDLPEVLRAKAYKYWTSGGKEDLKECIADLEKAIEIKPNYADAHHDLYIALGQDHQGRASLDALSRAYDLDPMNEKFGFSLANESFRSQNKPEDGLRIIDEVIERNPSNLIAVVQKSWMLSASPNGDLAGAFKLYHSAMKKDPFERPNPMIVFSMDIDLDPVRDKYAAIQKLQYPDNEDHTFGNILLIYWLTKDFDGARNWISYWETEKNLEPEIARLELASIESEFGNHGPALEVLEEIYPKFKDRSLNAKEIDGGFEWELRYYIELLWLTEQTEAAKLLADQLCEYYQNKANFKYIYAGEVDRMNVACYYAQNDVFNFNKALEEKYFVNKGKSNVFSELKSGYYRLFEDDPDFQLLKKRITEDIHRQRAEVIAYLKEEGDWDPAWDKELGLE